MPPFLQFILRRSFFACVSFVIITMVLYAGVMISPPKARARLYLPPGRGGERATENLINVIIREHHLDAPFPVQYGYWVFSLLDGSWGYSPTMRDDVLPSLVSRTPATLELAFLSLILFVPLGLASGLKSGWTPGGAFDLGFRSFAFLGTSTPPFILSMILLAVVYVKFGFAGPGRVDPSFLMLLSSEEYVHFTGFYAIDALLNHRSDLFFDVIKHLLMPAFTLTWLHWATLGRITRSTMIQERAKEYLVAARARGVNQRNLIWRHALRAILAPSLTSITLSAAGLVTGVFVVEAIFAIHGVSEVILKSMTGVPDAPAALGFSVYSVMMVIGLTVFLDVIQAVVDPRVRDEVLRS